MSDCFLITAIGTRGDLQPFVALGLGLAERYPKHQIIFCTHPEFEKFIHSFNRPQFEFSPVHMSPLEALTSTEEGKIIKTSRNIFQLIRAVRKFTLQTDSTWFREIVEAVKERRPKFVVLSTMPFFCDVQGYLREGVKPAIPYVVVHTVPFASTRYLAPPTAAMGMSASLQCVNRLMWTMTQSTLFKNIHEGPINLLRKEYNLPHPRTYNFEEEVNRHGTISLYAYSSNLLAPPPDWDKNLQRVMGPFEVPGHLAPAQESLSPELTAFIESSTSQGKKIVYIGLGSMLTVIFGDKPEKITLTLANLAKGVIQAVKSGLDITAIIHTVTVPLSKLNNSPPVALNSAETLGISEPCSFIYFLDKPCSHALLMPKMSLVVHHGGMGTTHAGFLAGRPAIILPCGPTSDQPFWADIVQRKKLGPKGFLISKLTPGRMEKVLKAAFGNYEEYSKNAEELGELMRKENAIQGTVNLIDELMK